jgi:hypothetical protein
VLASEAGALDAQLALAVDRAQRLDEQRAARMVTCVGCGHDREDVAPCTRPANGEEHGRPVTLMLCPLYEASIPDTAWVTRKEMRGMRGLADRRMLANSLYRGQRIIGFRESRGGDHRWHAQVVLADGTRVLLGEPE